MTGCHGRCSRFGAAPRPCAGTKVLRPPGAVDSVETGEEESECLEEETERSLSAEPTTGVEEEEDERVADGGPGLAAAGEDGLGGEQLDEWDEECLTEGLEGR